ncbi:MAG: zinc-binding dehydrogenase [Betaproteobacteria bacterium]|nr:zinc-binding dehydrogenase [Betaproteobacteria bacterium]
MKAVAIARFGGPEVLALMERPAPQPAAGEALVQLEYAGVNFIDIYMRSGHYARSQTYQTPLPMTIGMEGGGTVVALGDGVANTRIGDRVAYCIVRGSYAELAAVPASRLVRVPENVPLPVATALMLQGCTAHYLSQSVFGLGPGHVCLVHAGAGGVGQLLIQLAKQSGATVITTVGNAEKAAIARERGADHVVCYREEDFREAVMRVTGGKGVDVVYDAVGRETISKSVRSLKRRGLCVNYGGASGLVESVQPLELAEAGSVFFTRPHLADYIATAEELNHRTSDLFAAYAAGKLTVAIDREFPLAQAADAHRCIESRGTRGKLLLCIQS